VALRAIVPSVVLALSIAAVPTGALVCPGVRLGEPVESLVASGDFGLVLTGEGHLFALTITGSGLKVYPVEGVSLGSGARLVGAVGSGLSLGFTAVRVGDDGFVVFHGVASREGSVFEGSVRVERVPFGALSGRLGEGWHVLEVVGPVMVGSRLYAVGLLESVDGDLVAEVWDLTARRVVASFPATGLVALSVDGSSLVVGVEGGVVLVPLGGGVPRRVSVPGEVLDVAGGWVLYRAWDGYHVARVSVGGLSDDFRLPGPARRLSVYGALGYVLAWSGERVYVVDVREGRLAGVIDVPGVIQGISPPFVAFGDEVGVLYLAKIWVDHEAGWSHWVFLVDNEAKALYVLCNSGRITHRTVLRSIPRKVWPPYPVEFHPDAVGVVVAYWAGGSFYYICCSDERTERTLKELLRYPAVQRVFATLDAVITTRAVFDPNRPAFIVKRYPHEVVFMFEDWCDFDYNDVIVGVPLVPTGDLIVERVMRGKDWLLLRVIPPDEGWITRVLVNGEPVRFYVVTRDGRLEGPFRDVHVSGAEVEILVTGLREERGEVEVDFRSDRGVSFSRSVEYTLPRVTIEDARYDFVLYDADRDSLSTEVEARLVVRDTVVRLIGVGVLDPDGRVVAYRVFKGPYPPGEYRVTERFDVRPPAEGPLRVVVLAEYDGDLVLVGGDRFEYREDPARVEFDVPYRRPGPLSVRVVGYGRDWVELRVASGEPGELVLKDGEGRSIPFFAVEDGRLVGPYGEDRPLRVGEGDVDVVVMGLEPGRSYSFEVVREGGQEPAVARASVSLPNASLHVELEGGSFDGRTLRLRFTVSGEAVNSGFDDLTVVLRRGDEVVWRKEVRLNGSDRVSVPFEVSLDVSGYSGSLVLEAVAGYRHDTTLPRGTGAFRPVRDPASCSVIVRYGRPRVSLVDYGLNWLALDVRTGGPGRLEVKVNGRPVRYYVNTGGSLEGYGPERPFEVDGAKDVTVFLVGVPASGTVEVSEEHDGFVGSDSLKYRLPGRVEVSAEVVRAVYRVNEGLLRLDLKVTVRSPGPSVRDVDVRVSDGEGRVLDEVREGWPGGDVLEIPLNVRVRGSGRLTVSVSVGYDHDTVIEDPRRGPVPEPASCSLTFGYSAPKVKVLDRGIDWVLLEVGTELGGTLRVDVNDRKTRFYVLDEGSGRWRGPYDPFELKPGARAFVLVPGVRSSGLITLTLGGRLVRVVSVGYHLPRVSARAKVERLTYRDGFLDARIALNLDVENTVVRSVDVSVKGTDRWYVEASERGEPVDLGRLNLGEGHHTLILDLGFAPSAHSGEVTVLLKIRYEGDSRFDENGLEFVEDPYELVVNVFYTLTEPPVFQWREETPREEGRGSTPRSTPPAPVAPPTSTPSPVPEATSNTSSGSTGSAPSPLLWLVPAVGALGWLWTTSQHEGTGHPAETVSTYEEIEITSLRVFPPASHVEKRPVARKVAGGNVERAPPTGINRGPITHVPSARTRLGTLGSRVEVRIHRVPDGTGLSVRRWPSVSAAGGPVGSSRIIPAPPRGLSVKTVPHVHPGHARTTPYGPWEPREGEARSEVPISTLPPTGVGILWVLLSVVCAVLGAVLLYRGLKRSKPPVHALLLTLALAPLAPVHAQPVKVWVHVQPSFDTIMGADVYLVDNGTGTIYWLGRYNAWQALQNPEILAHPVPVYPEGVRGPLELDVKDLGVVVSSWFGVSCSDERTEKTLLEAMKTDERFRARILGDVCLVLTMFGRTPVHVAECHVTRTKDTVTFEFPKAGVTVRVVVGELSVETLDRGENWLELRVGVPSDGTIKVEENGEILPFYVRTDAGVKGPFARIDVREGESVDVIVGGLTSKSGTLEVVFKDRASGVEVAKRVPYGLPEVTVENVEVKPGPGSIRVGFELRVSDTTVRRVELKVIDCYTGRTVADETADVDLKDGDHRLEYTVRDVDTSHPLAVFVYARYDHDTVLENGRPVEEPATGFAVFTRTGREPEVTLDVEVPRRITPGLPFRLTVRPLLGEIPLATGTVRVIGPEGETLAEAPVIDGKASVPVLPTHAGRFEMKVEYLIGTRVIASKDVIVTVPDVFEGFTADVVQPGNLGPLGYDLKGTYLPNVRYPAHDSPAVFFHDGVPYVLLPADGPNAFLADDVEVTLPEPARSVHLALLAADVGFPITVTVTDSTGRKAETTLWSLDVDWNWRWKYGWTLYLVHLYARSLGLKDIVGLKLHASKGLLWVLSVTYEADHAYKALLAPDRTVTLCRTPETAHVNVPGEPSGPTVIWRKTPDGWVPFRVVPGEAVPADHVLLRPPSDADRIYILLYSTKDTTASYEILTQDIAYPLKPPYETPVPRSTDFNHLTILDIPCAAGWLTRIRGRVLVLDAPGAYVLAVTYRIDGRYEAWGPDGRTLTLTPANAPHYQNVDITRVDLDEEGHRLPTDEWPEGVLYLWFPIPNTVIDVQIPFYLQPADTDDAILVEKDTEVRLPKDTEAVYLLYIATDQRDGDRLVHPYTIDVKLADGKTVHVTVLLPDYLALARDLSDALLATLYARTDPVGEVLPVQRPAWYIPVLLRNGRPERADAYAWILAITSAGNAPITSITLHKPATGRLYVLAITAQTEDGHLKAVIGPGCYIDLTPPGRPWTGPTVDIVYPGQTPEQIPLDGWHREIAVKTPTETIPVPLYPPDGPNATPIATRKTTLNIVLPQPADAVYLLYLATGYGKASTPPTLPVLAVLDDGKPASALIRIVPAELPPTDPMATLAWAQPAIAARDLTVRQAPVLTWKRVYEPTGTVVFERKTAWLLEIEPEKGRLKALTLLPTDTNLTLYLLSVIVRIGNHYYALRGDGTLEPLNVERADATVETSWKPEHPPTPPKPLPWPGFTVDPDRKPYDYLHHVEIPKERITVDVGGEPVPLLLTGRLAPAVLRDIRPPKPADAVYLLYLTGHAPPTTPVRILVRYADGKEAILLVDLAGDTGLTDDPARTADAWTEPVLGWEEGAPIAYQRPALRLTRDDGEHVTAWLLELQAPPHEKISDVVILDGPPMGRLWLLAVTYRVGTTYHALLGPKEDEPLGELKVEVQLGHVTLTPSKPTLLIVHRTRNATEYALIDARNPELPRRWQRAPPTDEVIVKYGNETTRDVRLHDDTYLAILYLPPGFRYSPEYLHRWIETIKGSNPDENTAYEAIVATLPTLEACLYDACVAKMCEETGAEWARTLPGVVIAQVTVEKRTGNEELLKVSLDTPTVLLGVRFYANPVSVRDLSFRASVLVQVVENVVVSRVLNLPFYTDNEWNEIPSTIRQELEKTLQELQIKPHGNTNKQSSIQELTTGTPPQYNPTTTIIIIQKNHQKFTLAQILYKLQKRTQIAIESIMSAITLIIGTTTPSPGEPETRFGEYAWNTAEWLEIISQIIEAGCCASLYFLDVGTCYEEQIFQLIDKLKWAERAAVALKIIAVILEYYYKRNLGLVMAFLKDWSLGTWGDFFGKKLSSWAWSKVNPVTR